jgi:hypothetical protein
MEKKSACNRKHKQKKILPDTWREIVETINHRPFVERREEVYLCNCILGDDCRKEFAEIDKHDIVSKICDIIGSCPENLGPAEKVFEALRFEIARYVIHHEFARFDGVKTNMLVWLDSKANPDNAEKLTNFLMKYV